MDGPHVPKPVKRVQSPGAGVVTIPTQRMGVRRAAEPRHNPQTATPTNVRVGFLVGDRSKYIMVAYRRERNMLVIDITYHQGTTRCQLNSFYL